jgi:hypothetical protein
VKSGSSVYYIGKMVIIKFTKFLVAEHPEIRASACHLGGVEC